jgi:hypothetical protein
LRLRGKDPRVAMLPRDRRLRLDDAANQRHELLKELARRSRPRHTPIDLEQGEPLLRRQQAMTRWRQMILHVRQLKSPVGETFPPRLRSVDRGFSESGRDSGPLQRDPTRRYRTPLLSWQQACPTRNRNAPSDACERPWIAAFRRLTESRMRRNPKGQRKESSGIP